MTWVTPDCSSIMPKTAEMQATGPEATREYNA